MSRRTLSKAIIYAVLFIVTIVAIAPFYVMFIMSTYPTMELHKTVTMLPGNYFMTNLQTVIDGGFFKFYKNSLVTSLTVMLGSTIISAMAGYGFAKFKFKLNKPLHTFVIASMMIPYQLGLIGYVVEMRTLGLSNTLWPAILSSLVSCFGVFWMAQYIEGSVPDAIIESARLDGCPEPVIFLKIIMPYIRPATATLLILHFMWSWNAYLLPLVCLSDPELFTIPLGVSALGTRYQTDSAAQICGLTLGTLPLIVVFLFGSKTFIQGLTSGAVKG